MNPYLFDLLIFPLKTQIQVWRVSYLKGIASVRFSVNHLHNLLMNLFTRLIPITPNVAGTHPVLPYVKVLGIINILVRTRLDPVNNTGLEVDQDRSRDISGVVALVEKDIFAVTALGRKVLEVSILTDSVFLTQLLPKLAADLRTRKLAALSHFKI